MQEGVMHENWRDYTLNDIIKHQKEVCKGCKYFTKGRDFRIGECNYIAMTGKIRKCRPEVCDVRVEAENTPDKDKLLTVPLGPRVKSYLEV